MSRIPVTLVTGFLGSGKTTLIRQLLRQPEFENTLVIINEFGEAGIDHDLIEASSDDTVLLANGCLCCTIRGNLVDTLLDVRKQVAEGRLRDFDRVVVETSGVADPVALLGFLLGEAAVMAAYEIEGVVTTCEAVNGAETLASQPEAALQASVADRLLITKSDLVGENVLGDLEGRLRALNPRARILPVVHGEVSPEVVIGQRREKGGVSRLCCSVPGAHEHGMRFRSVSLTLVEPLAFAAVEDLMATIRAHMGPALVRLKAVLPLRSGGHVVIQASRGLLHPAEIRFTQLHGQGRALLITESEDAFVLVSLFSVFGLMCVS